MKVEDLFEGIKHKVIGDITGVDIQNITCDTRYVSANTCYYCINGGNIDGHTLADVVVEKGASLLVVNYPVDIDIPQIVVEDTRRAMSISAGNYYGKPRDCLKLIGVTGTNGKTTTTYMLQSILNKANIKAGVIGTLGIVIDNITLPNKLTTPDPIELHKTFRQMVDAGVEVAVMEVSAHAIELQKMAGIKCDIGILTNVTQDHLDYFGSMQRYAEVKKKFITNEYCNIGIVNIDDEVGREIALSDDNDIPIYTYGLSNPCDVFCPRYTFGVSGTKYLVNAFDDLASIDSKMIGKFNLYNALASISASKCLGINMDSIVKGISDLESVEGRCNVVNLDNNKMVIIDYAHTPDGLKNILTAIRPLTRGKLISVFGCGGNRDTSKRAIMGKISGECADYTILTSDNPRLENPDEIVEDIEAGISQVSQEYICIVDRREAIRFALNMAEAQDIIVLSGKGAEKYMDIGGIKHPYNDKDTVIEEYENLAIMNGVSKC